MLSHSSHVMTLANSIIGVGILAMPFCFQKCGIILSILLLVLSNWITRVCCHYLIKTSLLTRRKSFELLGLHAFGASGKLLAELCIIGYLIGNCITYFVVVGDLGPQIIAKMFALEETQHAHLRGLFMLVLTILCIVPLGMLRNVDSLSVLCTASIGFYVCLMLKIVLESESHIVANDWTQKVLYWEPAGIMQCLPIFSMSLSCQMQLFEVFESINNQSLEKLNGIVRNATWICTFVYISVGFFGYVAFCTHSFSGNILVNLSPSFGSDIIKIGFVLSIAFSFPLVIFPCRASIYSLLYRKGHVETGNYIPEQRFRAITLFIIVFSLCVSLVIPSVELIIGLVGSTIGVAICIMFPASSFRKIIKKESTERTFAQFVFVSGFCLMILGTYANLSAIDEQSSGPQFDGVQVATPLLPSGNLPPALDPQSSELLKRLAKEPKMQEQLQVNKLEGIKSDTKEASSDMEKAKILHAVSDKPPLPPLPVDEAHAGTLEKEAALENNKIAPLPTAKTKEAAPPAQPKNLTKDQTKLEKAVIAVPENSPDVAAQQTIDGAAIKKEEEIAAEEQKENKAKADELRETQNELKKTKELLERTVDELKVELAKQNQETQNLVVEKLDKVVEKVEQIERKVQQGAPREPPSQAPAKVEAAVAAKPKATLMDLLTEKAHAREEQEAHAGVYEPLSYKTGELLNNASAAAAAPALMQRLPLPLPLLINATQAKANGTLKAPSETDIENVEAIRRELLQLKPVEVITSSTPLARVKRDTAEQQLPENCLSEPQLGVLDGGAAAISLQIENLGRDLKSLREDDDAVDGNVS